MIKNTNKKICYLSLLVFRFPRNWTKFGRINRIWSSTYPPLTFRLLGVLPCYLKLAVAMCLENAYPSARIMASSGSPSAHLSRQALGPWWAWFDGGDRRWSSDVFVFLRSHHVGTGTDQREWRGRWAIDIPDERKWPSSQQRRPWNGATRCIIHPVASLYVANTPSAIGRVFGTKKNAAS